MYRKSLILNWFTKKKRKKIPTDMAPLEFPKTFKMNRKYLTEKYMAKKVTKDFRKGRFEPHPSPLLNLPKLYSFFLQLIELP